MYIVSVTQLSIRCYLQALKSQEVQSHSRIWYSTNVKKISFFKRYPAITSLTIQLRIKTFFIISMLFALSNSLQKNFRAPPPLPETPCILVYKYNRIKNKKLVNV